METDVASSLTSARKFIAQCRIYLDCDVGTGLIAVAARDDVDRCYVAVADLLDEACVEIEAADPRLDGGGLLLQRLIGACVLLALCAFCAMYMEDCPQALRGIARRVRADAHRLRKQLWLRLEHAA